MKNRFSKVCRIKALALLLAVSLTSPGTAAIAAERNTDADVTDAAVAETALFVPSEDDEGTAPGPASASEEGPENGESDAAVQEDVDSRSEDPQTFEEESDNINHNETSIPAQEEEDDISRENKPATEVEEVKEEDAVCIDAETSNLDEDAIDSAKNVTSTAEEQTGSGEDTAGPETDTNADNGKTTGSGEETVGSGKDAAVIGEETTPIDGDMDSRAQEPSPVEEITETADAEDSHFAGSEHASEDETENSSQAEPLLPARTDPATQEIAADGQEESVQTDSADKMIYSGACGENLTWSFDGDDTLTITGDGPMKDYYYSWVEEAEFVDEREYYLLPAWINEYLPVKNVNIQGNVTSIGAYSFYNCYSLEKLTIPSTVTRISLCALCFCSKLQEIVFEGTKAQWTSIAVYDGNAPVRSVKVRCSDGDYHALAGQVSDTVSWEVDGDTLYFKGTGEISGVSIDTNTLYKIENVLIGEGITGIADYCFSAWSSNYSWAGIRTFHLPSTLVSIGTEAFSSKDSFHVYYNGSMEQWENIQKGEYNDRLNSSMIECTDGTIRNGGSCGETASWSYGGGTLTISGSGKIADYDYSSTPWKKSQNAIREVVVEEGITGVGAYAFYDCQNLQSVRLPSTVSSLGEASFEGCSRLSGISFPSGLTSIGKDAFYGAALTEVTIPGSLREMGENAFYGCRYLRQLTIEEGVSVLGNSAFSFCSGLQEITIPGSVETVPEYAFHSCIGLERLILQEGVRSFGIAPFAYCKNLESLVIPSTVHTMIPVMDCYSLKEVTYGGSALQWKTILESSGCSDDPDSEDYSPLMNKDLIVHCAKAKMEDAFIEFPVEGQEPLIYDGTPKTPVIGEVSYNRVILRKGNDYTVSYSDNTNAGENTAKVIITGINDFEGTVEKPFTILKAEQSITASDLSLTYPNGGKISAAGAQGPLSYASSDPEIAEVDDDGNVIAKAPGTVTVSISAAETDNYIAAVKDVTVTIAKMEQSITANAAAPTVAVGKTDAIKVTGAKGKVTYKSSAEAVAAVSAKGVVTGKKVGTAKITVTSAATDYYNKATKTVTIKVVPAATTKLTAASQAKGIKLTWAKVEGATGYKIYRGSAAAKKITSGSTVTWTDAKATVNGTKYTYKIIAYAGTGDSTLSKSLTTYQVARPSISALTNPSAKTMKVKWAKNAKATGYQIQYSLNKSFASGNKAVTIGKNTTVTKTVVGLTKGKTYYVRIRTYKTVGGTKYWSAWSTAKTVKITK